MEIINEYETMESIEKAMDDKIGIGNWRWNIIFTEDYDQIVLDNPFQKYPVLYNVYIKEGKYILEMTKFLREKLIRNKI